MPPRPPRCWGSSALTRNEVGRLPVDMVLTMAPGEPATLAVTDGTHRVEVAGEVPQTALTRPTDEELARRALESAAVRHSICKT